MNKRTISFIDTKLMRQRKMQKKCYLHIVVGNYAMINCIATMEEQTVCILNAQVKNDIFTKLLAEVLGGIKNFNRPHCKDTTIMTDQKKYGHKISNSM
jgi:hypothetical protein